MVVPMMRPDVFSALASHAGDALFELSMPPSFAATIRTLRDHFESSWDVFFRAAAGGGPVRLRPLRRAARDVRLRRGLLARPGPARQGAASLHDRDGRLVPDVWERWLAHDPVRMAAGHGDALRSMRRIYLDAGKGDEYFLDLGAQAFSAELNKLGVEHTLDALRRQARRHRLPLSRSDPGADRGAERLTAAVVDPRLTAMTSRTAKRLTLLVPTIATSLLLVACEESVTIGGGTLEKTEIEDTVSKALTKKVGQAPASFVCPSDLDAKVGASETCTLTDDKGAEYDTTVTIDSVSDDGSSVHYDIRVADQPKSTG